MIPLVCFDPQHWRDRVNKEELRKQGTLLSTVGIDINELILERRTKGSVVFRTWDFGGQVGIFFLLLI